MELIRKFERLGKSDAPIAGGKGASLGEMTQAGIPVPPGFVVLSASFEQFLKETDLNVEIDAIIDTVKHEEMHTVEYASEKIQGLILNSNMPENIRAEILTHFRELGAEYVAVRSSATAEDSSEAAWAGQLDSFLNTTEATLLQNVRRCWASLFTPRAIFYRFEKELHKQKISVAVVVQKMVNSEKSGIAFSVHPVTEDRNQLIIEAGFGLGEAIVSGSVTPDSYVVTKEPREILDMNISSQGRALYRVEGGGNKWEDLGAQGDEQVLTEDQVKELSTLIIKIEDHYGFPCDIEWAFENNTFYITQSRPITTLMVLAEEVSVDYTGANNDVATAISQVKLGKQNEYVFLRKRYIPTVWPLNTYWASEVTEDISIPPCGVIHIYEQGELQALLDKQFLSQVGSALLVKIEKQNDLITLRNNGIKAGKDLVEQCQTFADKSGNASIEEYIQFFERVNESYAVLFKENARYWVGVEKPVHAELEKLLSGYSEEQNKEIFQTMTLPLLPSYSNVEEEQFAELIKDARQLGEDSEELAKKVKDFASKYIWFPYEYVGPSVYDFDTVLNRIKESLRSNEPVHYQESQTDIAVSHQRIIEKYGLTDRMIWLFQALQTFALMQDDRKMYNSQSCYLVNKLIIEKLSEKLDIATELLRYMDVELLRKYSEGTDKVAFEAELRQREQFLIMVKDGKETILVSGTAGRKFAEEQGIPLKEEIEGSEIRGQSAYPGVVRGIARLIKNSGQADHINEGDILITYMTTPDFVPLLKKVGAIVTDEGGITCHAAIVARELKKPCVIGTKHAMSVIKDGDTIEVDANTGIIKVIEL